MAMGPPDFKDLMTKYGGVQRTISKTGDMLDCVAQLDRSDVLVGIPKANNPRKDSPIGNAAIAYIHEFGSPAHNIPERAFLRPGLKKVKNQVIALFRQGAMDCLNGSGNVDKTLNKVGILARNSVVEAITDPEPPFVPLKPATIRARLRRTAAGRRKLRGLKKIKNSAGWSGAQSNEALTTWAESSVMGDLNIHPLIDTAQLRAAITYVVRKL